MHKTKKMKKTVRVEIPRNADKMIALAKEVLKSHKDLGDKSPLQGIDMKDLEVKMKEAELLYADGRKKKREGEALYEGRDRFLGKDKGQGSTTPGTVLYYLTSVRDILLGLNRGREHKLGLMGYEVHTSPKATGDKPEEPDK